MQTYKYININGKVPLKSTLWLAKSSFINRVDIIKVPQVRNKNRYAIFNHLHN